MKKNLPRIAFKRFNERIFKQFRQKGLGRTIFFWFLSLSLAPLLIASIISYLTASSILEKEAYKSLETVSRLKSNIIVSFFNEKINGLKLLSSLTTNVTYLTQTNKDYKNSKVPLKQYIESIRYNSTYSIIWWDMNSFLKSFNYEDIYLLDLEGNIHIVSNEESLLGSNVFTGIFAKTRFAQKCRYTIETGETSFSDMEYIGDEKKTAVGFLIKMVINQHTKEKLGIMAVKLSIDQINNIMLDKTAEENLIQDNMDKSITNNVIPPSKPTPSKKQDTDSSQSIEKTLQTFLIGEDLKMRSISKPGEQDSSIVKATINTRITQNWRDSKEKGKIIRYTNHHGKTVLGLYYNLDNLQILKARWGLIAEINETEAFYSAYKLRWIVVGIVFATIFLVSVISILASRRIVKPILKLSEWAQRVSIGDLSYEEIPYQEDEIGQTSESFRKVVDSFQAVTRICETIAIGDFTKTVDIRSEKDDLGKAVNQMRDNLVEVVYQANNISMGDYSGKVTPKSENDMLGIALERMTRTLHDAAMVAEEVSVGDYSLEVEIKGEKDMLGKALNQMIIRLKDSNLDSQRKIDYLNNIPTPVHVIDSNFTIQFINKAGAIIVGKTVNECIGKKCYALFNTSHCQSERCRAYRAMNQNKVLTGDTVANLPDRQVPMRYTSAPLKDTYGNIIGAIEYMVDISDEMQVVGLAEKISRGDYSVNVQKRSDDDRLSDALNRMTQSLRQALEENRRQNWLKSGQTELNNRMRGELDIPDLAQNIINFLTSYLEAQVGILYFSSGDDTLKMVGSYALGKEKSVTRKFKFGEGIIGQAAKENRVIELSNIPQDQIKIRTGFGDINPKNLIILPFTYEGTVIGVIELATLYDFTDIQREFLTQSLENIGIALNSAESRTQLTELLLKTQEQAEKLQQQQEELRQSNEELEGQTKALIASETNLQSQQEELRVINEELEERTRALEKQKADIQQKNLELLMARNEIEKKARDLEEVSKYKSEFLANMSHELRTPLNSILILSQLLSNNTDRNLSDKQVEFSKTIHSSGSDLLNLINEILDLSKIEAGMMEIRIETIPIDEIVGGLERIFKPVASNKGLEFAITIDKDILPENIDTDSQRVQQILKNLLSNAFKFTEKGGITLRVHKPPVNQVMNQPNLTPENIIAFSVIDTGIGIPKDKQSIIFEAFRQEDGTTSRKYGGTGLGLSISRELAWLLGGEIQMESERGKGSTFTLYLPEKLEKPGEKMPLERRKMPMNPKDIKENVIQTPPDSIQLIETEQLLPKETPSELPEPTPTFFSPPAPQQREIRDDRRSIKPEDKSLLIIEDDPIFAEVLLNLAQSKGFKTLIVDNGETGLHFADFYKPSAIVLDVKLPGMDGWEVLDRLKSNPETRHIPVHLMSGVENVSEAMSKGAIGYLKKPISTETMDAAFKKIERIIAKPVKKLLVIDSDDDQKRSIMQMIGSGDVATVTVGSGEEALIMLKKGSFDTIILNLELKDMNGFDLIEKISSDETHSQIPIIIYSEEEMNQSDQDLLKKYAQRIVIKNVQGMEALFAETTLFLHRVEEELPDSKQKLFTRMLDKEAIMKNKKILIVDDDMRNVFALTSILEEKGMKTIVGKNGREGIEKLNSEPDIDLVLMDIMMPIMDGYEAMKTIRKDRRFEKLPIIALTAKAMKGDRNKCVAAGANDYLAKPVDPAKLLSLLRVWLYG